MSCLSLAVAFVTCDGLPRSWYSLYGATEIIKKSDMWGVVPSHEAFGHIPVVTELRLGDVQILFPRLYGEVLPNAS